MICNNIRPLWCVWQELDEVNKKFKELKEKNTKQNASDTESQLLKDIAKEAKELKDEVERKMKEIEGQHIIEYTVIEYTALTQTHFNGVWKWASWLTPLRDVDNRIEEWNIFKE